MYKVESIREIQQLELIIAKEIKRICEENNIQYFLVGGTLLGSIRHNGFIPWDDDMDIGMLYPEWERFILCAKKQLSKKFYIDVWDDDNLFGYPFAKVRLAKTVMKEKTVDGLDVNMGIWVDVFPYCPTNKRKVNKSIKRLQFVSKAYLLKVGYKINSITSSKVIRLINSLISIFVAAIPQKKLRAYYEKLISEIYSKKPELYLEIDGRFKGQFVFEKDVFECIEMAAFEDTSFPIPIKYGKYLEKAYGNYMELPPEEQRYIGHSISDVYLEENIDYYLET